jgi:protein phosphatase
VISRKGLCRNPEVEQLLHRTRNRTELADKFVVSYRRYCWPVRSVDDLKLAPFHPLVSEGKFHTSGDHRWHMETLAGLCAHGAPLLVSTDNQVIGPHRSEIGVQGTEWWTKLTDRGGGGMIVKPLDFIARARRSLAQPVVKCRGPEYLRIILQL